MNRNRPRTVDQGAARGHVSRNMPFPFVAANDLHERLATCVCSSRSHSFSVSPKRRQQ